MNDSLKKPTPRSKLRGIYGFLPFGTGRRPTRCFLGTLQRAAGNDQVQGKIEATDGRAASIGADVGDTAQCAELVRQAEETFGRVDILVSNAGIGQPHKIVDTPDEEWERVMNVNARATFALARELLPGMIKRKFGRFVAISSNIAVYGRGGGSFATYGASKAALIALTKGIAHEGAPFVTANAICPGPTVRELAEDRTTPKKRTVFCRIP